ncbi:MAG: amino acid ABC transporter substrate-binding protein [Methanocorpusculum sp.]|nr:amino acid ABC transporter substrate-binding protein [Methanocorpusculum parvum]MBQ4134263.1 amino acid ABC transporter substrate-binding protein [Methanocorpusculum sp.]
MHKKALMGIGVSLLVIFAVLMAGCVTTDDNVYVVGIDAEYPPYAYIAEDGTPAGFDVESIQWIAEQKGFEVEIQPIAWDSLIPNLQTGKVDMVYAGLSITPYRAERIAFSIPYWNVDLAVAAQAGDDVTMDDFNAGDVTIGVQRGCSSNDWLELHFGTEAYNQMVKDGKIKLFDSFPMSMVALGNGQVETVIFDDAGIDEYIIGNDKLVKLGVTDTGEQFAVGFALENTELRDLVNEGLEELMASDKWTELKEKYNLVEE